ncbi:MAG: zinc ABC transporter substrate-binding protein, partial [Cellulosilyticum sp.]|nr:zinc ABC transporter substrate-binding protein [Cellulosilyticum sp.]
MKKNKMWMLGVILSLCSGMVVGCGNEAQETTKANEVQEVEENTDTKQDKISVVCTIFPQYDWVKELIGAQSENYDLTVLLDNGVDLHSYQPTAEDIAKIADCDVFIYVGGESDGWVEDALKEATNKNMQVINLLDVLGEAVKEEEIVEGMEHGHHHEHEE